MFVLWPKRFLSSQAVNTTMSRDCPINHASTRRRRGGSWSWDKREDADDDQLCRGVVNLVT